MKGEQQEKLHNFIRRYYSATLYRLRSRDSGEQTNDNNARSRGQYYNHLQRYKNIKTSLWSL